MDLSQLPLELIVSILLGLVLCFAGYRLKRIAFAPRKLEIPIVVVFRLAVGTGDLVTPADLFIGYIALKLNVNGSQNTSFEIT